MEDPALTPALEREAALLALSIAAEPFVQNARRTIDEIVFRTLMEERMKSAGETRHTNP